MWSTESAVTLVSGRFRRQLRAGFEALIVVDAAACDFGAHKPCIGGDTECFEVPRCMFVVCALKSSYLGDPGTVFLDLDGVGKGPSIKTGPCSQLCCQK